MDLTRVYMLASDHRWQWEEWCDKAGVARERIPEVKRIVYDGFLAARSQSPDVAAHGALLFDSKYAAEPVALAQRAGIPVGSPVEEAGKFPLEWERQPFHAAVHGNSFVKVLVRYRPEWTDAAQRGQMDKLLELQAWCRQQETPLLVEIIIMRVDEDEREFEEHGRPAMLASVIRGAYTSGLVPQIWKIEASSTLEGAAAIDHAIRERPEPRQLILGKGADTKKILGWFAASAPLPSTAGFAIGRSVFWDPATAYLTNRSSREDAAAEVTSRYLSLVGEWKKYEHAVAG